MSEQKTEQNETGCSDTDAPELTVVETSLKMINDFAKTEGVTCACLIFMENGTQIYAVGDPNTKLHSIRRMVKEMLQVMEQEEGGAE